MTGKEKILLGTTLIVISFIVVKFFPWNLPLAFIGGWLLGAGLREVKN